MFNTLKLGLADKSLFLFNFGFSNGVIQKNDKIVPLLSIDAEPIDIKSRVSYAILHEGLEHPWILDTHWSPEINFP